MPKNGYTALFQNMIKNDNIKVKLNTDYKKIKDKIIPRYATVYTGPPDVFFNNKFGKLDWRSLNFKFKTYKKRKFRIVFKLIFLININLQEKLKLNMLQSREYQLQQYAQNIQVLQAIHIIQLIIKKI